MDWKGVDGRLFKLRELLLSLEFLEGYDRELKRMNSGKVGRPYTWTERYVKFLSVVRYFSVFPIGSLKASRGR